MYVWNKALEEAMGENEEVLSWDITQLGKYPLSLCSSYFLGQPSIRSMYFFFVFIYLFIYSGIF